MSYKVIHSFTDLQDSNHLYKVGDKFPRLELNVSEQRIRELASVNNKQGRALIEKVKTVSVEEPTEEVKTVKRKRK